MWEMPPVGWRDVVAGICLTEVGGMWLQGYASPRSEGCGCRAMPPGRWEIWLQVYASPRMEGCSCRAMSYRGWRDMVAGRFIDGLEGCSCRDIPLMAGVIGLRSYVSQRLTK
jgi:hypothetical protein